MTSSAKELSSALSNLRVDTPSNKSKRQPKPVADSWEDEADSPARQRQDESDPSTESSELNSPVELSRQSTNFNPQPPPPTPATASAPRFSFSDLEAGERFAHLSKTTSTTARASPPQPSSPTAAASPQRASSTRTPESGGGGAPASAKRPDKTTATASRLIAAGLGMKLPKRTDAEKEYDKVTRDTARKQRDKEREDAKKQQEEAERAKAAVWDD